MRYVKARIPGLMDRYVVLYDREFSHSEIKGLVRFYSADLGRKSVKSMGKIAKQGRKTGFNWGRRVNKKARAAASAKLREKGVDMNKYKK